MKRSQDFVPASPSRPFSPIHKKVKVGSPGAQQANPFDAAGDAHQPGSPEWTRVDKRRAKKARKAEAKLEARIPRFMYVNNEIVKRRDAIHIDDIRDLVLHLVGDSPPPNWLRIEEARSINKVVALLIPGILPSFINLPPLPTSATANPNLPLPIPLPSDHRSGIPFIASTFSHACPTRAPGEQTRMWSVLSQFFQCPLHPEERRRREKERKISERMFDKDPTQYLLTLQQMVENDYPIPSYMADMFQKSDGWVETPCADPEAVKLLPQDRQRSRIYAIDCEMCLTEDGKELTRVCVIDYATNLVVYDTLVKPPKPVIDYLTRWSGITEEFLSKATTTLPEVQAYLLTLLAPRGGPNAILLGHSLESDLRALRLCHPLCIDTAVIYHHPRGRPLKPGLAWLTKKWAGREIQTRGEGGHDPEEDARACLDLLKLKIANGAWFGEFKTDTESIFERMSRATRIGGGGGTVRSAVVDHGNPGVMHGSKANACVGCASDDEVLQGLLQVVPGHEFTFGRFTGLADALGWVTPKGTAEPPPIPGTAAPACSSAASTSTPGVKPTPPSPSPETVRLAQERINSQLLSLYTALPARTAFVIFTGHSDPRRMSALNGRKAAFETAIKNGRKAEDMDRATEWWTAADGRELEEEVEKAKRGLMFLGVK